MVAALLIGKPITYNSHYITAENLDFKLLILNVTWILCMKPFVIIATKGRAKETRVLLDYLLAQSLMPHFVVVVGSEQSDIEGLDTHPFIEQKKRAVSYI